MASEKIGDAVTEQEIYELKWAAVKYYTENGVTERMEEILNSMFFANPDDVYGHLSNFFATYSKVPTICGLRSHQALDSRGEPTLQVDIYGKVKNFEKLLSRTTVSNKNPLTDLWKIEDKEAAETNRLESVTEAINYVANHIETKLCNTNICNQNGIDEIIYAFIDDIRVQKEDEAARENAASEALTDAVTPRPGSDAKKPSAKSPKGKKATPVVITPDPPAELVVPGCELVSALSMGVCQAAASVTDKPLYQYIINILEQDEPPEKLRLPLPVITILQGGKSSPGKQNCVKEFMVTTCPGTTVSEGLQKIRSIQATVFKTLFVKAGAFLRNVSETGAMMPTLDRPEQGLDIIQEAATQLGFEAGTDYHILLNLGAKDIFDYDKGKYEVTAGQLKLADELVDFYADIVSRYPSIIGLIDPIRAVEKEAWYKLGEKISEHCYIFDEEGHDRPGKYKNTLKFTECFNTSGIVFKYDEMTTISHLMDCAKLLKEKKRKVMLSTSVGETNDTFLTDLAVGIGADFLRIGGLNRGERIGKLNRLLQIESDVYAHNKLDTNPEHDFPTIRPPEVDPVSEDGVEGENAAKFQDAQTPRSPKK